MMRQETDVSFSQTVETPPATSPEPGAIKSQLSPVTSARSGHSSALSQFEADNSADNNVTTSLRISLSALLILELHGKNF